VSHDIVCLCDTTTVIPKSIPSLEGNSFLAGQELLLNFMVLEDSLLYSQEPTSGHYFELHKASNLIFTPCSSIVLVSSPLP
jgi:hypothetical protein